MQVKQIEEQLQEKHSGQFTPDQIRAWANYNQRAKYDSLDVPPITSHFGEMQPRISRQLHCHQEKELS